LPKVLEGGVLDVPLLPLKARSASMSYKGWSGYSGYSGTSGASGSSGPVGPPGPSGSSGESGLSGFSGIYVGVKKNAPFGIGQWVMDKEGDLFFVQSYYKSSSGGFPYVAENEVFCYRCSNGRVYSEHEIEAAPGFPKVPASWPEDACFKLGHDRQACCWNFDKVGPHHQIPPCPDFLKDTCWLSRLTASS
jgi:hypothetical protein